VRSSPVVVPLRVASLAIAIAIAGCAGTGGKLSPASCSRPGICEISVTVDECRITVPDRYHVFGPGRVIRWTLVAPPEYHFPPNGVAFTHPGSVFDTPGHARTTFTWHDRNPASEGQPGSQGTEHKYEVNILRGDVPCPPLDPWIVNHG
jgi:hypothetical protein